MKNKKIFIFVILSIIVVVLLAVVIKFKETNNQPVNYSSQQIKESNITEILNGLRDNVKINFTQNEYKEMVWYSQEQQIRLQGESINAKNVDTKLIDKINPYLETQGFIKDVFNISAGTIGGSTGLQKDNIVCVVSTVITGYNPNEDTSLEQLDTSKYDVYIACGELNN